MNHTEWTSFAVTEILVTDPMLLRNANTLSQALGLPPADTRNLSANTNAFESISGALDTWKAIKGANAGLQQLCETLRRIGLVRSAEKVEAAFLLHPPSLPIPNDPRNTAMMLTKLQQLERKIEQLQNTFIPVGFIYVQFPNQLSPQEMWRDWPTMRWKDVTVKYEGCFFRAEDKSSNRPFDQKQAESCPRLEEVSMRYNIQNHTGSTTNAAPVTLPLGDHSDFITSGYFSVGNAGHMFYDQQQMRFKTSGAPVHPENFSIRIWKRK